MYLNSEEYKLIKRRLDNLTIYCKGIVDKMNEDKEYLKKLFKWDPWEAFKEDLEILPIEEPPCKYCSYWKPRREYERKGNFIGIICCNSENMYTDFSCYKPIKL